MWNRAIEWRDKIVLESKKNTCCLYFYDSRFLLYLFLRWINRAIVYEDALSTNNHRRRVTRVKRWRMDGKSALTIAFTWILQGVVYCLDWLTLLFFKWLTQTRVAWWISSYWDKFEFLERVFSISYHWISSKKLQLDPNYYPINILNIHLFNPLDI